MFARVAFLSGIPRRGGRGLGPERAPSFIASALALNGFW